MSKLPWLKFYIPWCSLVCVWVSVLNLRFLHPISQTPPPTPSSWSCYAKYADPPHLPLSGPHVLVGMRVRTWPRYCIILYYVYSLPEKFFFAPGQGGERGGEFVAKTVQKSIEQGHNNYDIIIIYYYYSIYIVFSLEKIAPCELSRFLSKKNLSRGYMYSVERIPWTIWLRKVCVCSKKH